MVVGFVVVVVVGFVVVVVVVVVVVEAVVLSLVLWVEPAEVETTVAVVLFLFGFLS